MAEVLGTNAWFDKYAPIATKEIEALPDPRTPEGEEFWENLAERNIDSAITMLCKCSASWAQTLGLRLIELFG